MFLTVLSSAAFSSKWGQQGDGDNLPQPSPLARPAAGLWAKAHYPEPEASLPSFPPALHTARVMKSLFLQHSLAWGLYLSQATPWFLSWRCCVSPFTFVQLQQPRVGAYLFLGFLVKIHLLDKWSEETHSWGNCQCLQQAGSWTGTAIARKRESVQMGSLIANISSWSNVAAWNRNKLSCNNANYHCKSNNNNK